MTDLECRQCKNLTAPNLHTLKVQFTTLDHTHLSRLTTLRELDIGFYGKISVKWQYVYESLAALTQLTKLTIHMSPLAGCDSAIEEKLCKLGTVKR